MMKIGFLLPRSTVYPLISFDFLDGFKSYLEKEGIADKFDIKSENIGFGLDEAEVYSKNEELLLKENVEIVIAFIDGRSAEMLQPLYAATGKILLLVNMGAHYAYDAAVAPSTIHHTFDVAFNSRLTGKLAAANHKEAVLATSYYDGGYLQCFAMASRFIQGGGAIAFNFIGHYQPKSFTIAPLEEFLQTAATDTLLCLSSGDVSHLLYEGLSYLQEKRDLHLFVSPMMVEESLKAKLKDDFTIRNVKGYTAWHSGIDNKFNQVFKEEFHRHSGRQASIFALLGWETGTLLKELQLASANGIKGQAAVKQLKQMVFESPRGWLKFDEETNQTYSPSFLIAARDNFSLTIEDCIEDTDAERKNFILEKPEGAASGWRNTYLCS
jgi:branched-chain amino acid transport system substrate-binding protein